MRNLLLLLLLANILYFMYGWFTEETPEAGIVVVDEADLGPPLDVTTEHSDDVAASVGAVLGSGEPSALDAVVGRSCVSVGPFRTNVDAENEQAQYAGDGMRARLRSQIGELKIGNWVKIRDIPDRFTANEMEGRLKDSGMDAYIVDDDEGISISLGLFGDINGAEKIELQAKSLGFPATIEQATREGTVWYVDIALPPGRGAGAIVDKHGEELVALRDAATCPPDR
ncbi:MAG: hypothetical protein AAF351_13600 [Pseudomonadota bacterium]